MPHSTVPATGFQAVVLCGPGASFDTFTSHPGDQPKALLPIANRPMVWYALEWLHRTGITSITLITPPESAPALESALRRDPHLTSLPSPRPEVLAPKDLTPVTGTAAIFRLPEVTRAITSDFLVVPCDLVCDLDGTSLLQTWMILEEGLGGESVGRRGGLGVWYPIKAPEGVIIGKSVEQADMIGTVAIGRSTSKSGLNPPEDSLRPDVHNLVLSIPTSTVKDIVEEKGHLPIRHAQLKRHGNVRFRKSHRDAHIYFFPRWALDMMQVNEFDSVAEDVVGWWAKAGWQNGLGDKLGLRNILQNSSRSTDMHADYDLPPITPGEDLSASGFIASPGSIEDEISILGLSSTYVRPTDPTTTDDTNPQLSAASRVPRMIASALAPPPPLLVPPFLSYIQPSPPNTTATAKDPTSSAQPHLIRRADSTPILLALSLHLARLPASPQDDPFRHPHSHVSKIASPESTSTTSSALGRTTQAARISEADCLVDANVTIGTRAVLKETVVGNACKIGAGARLTRCLLMEGAEVGDGVVLTGCVLGRRCRVEGPTAAIAATASSPAATAAAGGAEEATKLVDCEVAAGFVVETGTEAKGEKFVAFEGLDDELENDDHDDDDGAGFDDDE